MLFFRICNSVISLAAIFFLVWITDWNDIKIFFLYRGNILKRHHIELIFTFLPWFEQRFVSRWRWRCKFARWARFSKWFIFNIVVTLSWRFLSVHLLSSNLIKIAYAFGDDWKNVIIKQLLIICWPLQLFIWLRVRIKVILLNAMQQLLQLKLFSCLLFCIFLKGYEVYVTSHILMRLWSESAHFLI